MAILKCKMCGDNIEVSADKTYGTCESCGSTMTLPKIDDDQRANLFNRANRFRQIGEFDKAISAYESILNQQDDDAEAHWCVVLSRFGIEYVEDPKSRERIPTCHRLHTLSILSDPDYLAALEHTTDSYTKELYQKEATRIAKIQKEIIAISANEKPYDIFICYKESDESGGRTKDSTMAQEIYYQLTGEGYKVFFSRITLEDKLGQAYEPYIFAALNSAKVMLVVGSKQEYFNAIWVKNEWSRYLDLMAKDKSRILIPCYRDMDAYDIPDALSMFQSQDMGKIGFVQDLIRGVKKVLVKQETSAHVKSSVVQPEVPSNITALLKRGMMALEDGEWHRADRFFEEVLNSEAESAEAYLGKLCAALRCPDENSLKNQPASFAGNLDYKKVVRFDPDGIGQRLQGYIAFIDERNEETHKNNTYQNAMIAKNKNTVASYQDAIRLFADISGYKDATEQAELCKHLGEECRKENIYQKALAEKNKGTETSFEEADKLFVSIPDYKDTSTQRIECQIGRQECIYQCALVEKNKSTEPALKEAEQLFATISDYKDASAQCIECSSIARDIKCEAIYQEGLRLMDTKYYGDFKVAEKLFRSIIEYRDAEKKANKCVVLDADVEKALREKAERKRIEEENQRKQKAAKRKKRKLVVIVVAVIIVVGALLFVLTNQSRTYSKASTLSEQGNYGEAAIIFSSLGDYRDAVSQAEQLTLLWRKQTENISAGAYHTIGLKSDGSVVATGSNTSGQCNVDDWTDIISVAAGANHTVGLRSDGTVVAVGDNFCGQCDVMDWEGIVSIAAGDGYTVGLKIDGSVVAVGTTANNRSDVNAWNDIVSVSASDAHTIGIQSDGTVVAVGSNGSGRSNVTTWTNIVSVSAGGYHTVGIESDGTVVAVGGDSNGQCDVSDWSNIVAVFAGTSHTIGLKSDGTVVAVGLNTKDQCEVGDWTDIVAISAGETHTIGLKSDGTVVATGSDSNGQCDVSDWTDIALPTM